MDSGEESNKLSQSDTLNPDTASKRPIQLGVVQSSTGSRNSAGCSTKKSRWDQGPGTGETEEDNNEQKSVLVQPGKLIPNVKDLVKKFEGVTGSLSELEESTQKVDEEKLNKPATSQTPTRVKLIRTNFMTRDKSANNNDTVTDSKSAELKSGAVDNVENSITNPEESTISTGNTDHKPSAASKALEIISSSYDSADDSSEEADPVSINELKMPKDSAYASPEKINDLPFESIETNPSSKIPSNAPGSVLDNKQAFNLSPDTLKCTAHPTVEPSVHFELENKTTKSNINNTKEADNSLCEPLQVKSDFMAKNSAESSEIIEAASETLIINEDSSKKICVDLGSTSSHNVEVEDKDTTENVSISKDDSASNNNESSGIKSESTVVESLNDKNTNKGTTDENISQNQVEGDHKSLKNLIDRTVSDKSAKPDFSNIDVHEIETEGNSKTTISADFKGKVSLGSCESDINYISTEENVLEKTENISKNDKHNESVIENTISKVPVMELSKEPNTSIVDNSFESEKSTNFSTKKVVSKVSDISTTSQTNESDSETKVDDLVKEVGLSETSKEGNIGIVNVTKVPGKSTISVIDGSKSDISFDDLNIQNVIPTIPGDTTFLDSENCRRTEASLDNLILQKDRPETSDEASVQVVDEIVMPEGEITSDSEGHYSKSDVNSSTNKIHFSDSSQSPTVSGTEKCLEGKTNTKSESFETSSAQLLSVEGSEEDKHEPGMGNSIIQTPPFTIPEEKTTDIISTTRNDLESKDGLDGLTKLENTSEYPEEISISSASSSERKQDAEDSCTEKANISIEEYKATKLDEDVSDLVKKDEISSYANSMGTLKSPSKQGVLRDLTENPQCSSLAENQESKLETESLIIEEAKDDIEDGNVTVNQEDISKFAHRSNAINYSETSPEISLSVDTKITKEAIVLQSQDSVVEESNLNYIKQGNLSTLHKEKSDCSIPQSKIDHDMKPINNKKQDDTEKENIGQGIQDVSQTSSSYSDIINVDETKSVERNELSNLTKTPIVEDPCKKKLMYVTGSHADSEKEVNLTSNKEKAVHSEDNIVFTQESTTYNDAVDETMEEIFSETVNKTSDQATSETNQHLEGNLLELESTLSDFDDIKTNVACGGKTQAENKPAEDDNLETKDSLLQMLESEDLPNTSNENETNKHFEKKNCSKNEMSKDNVDHKSIICETSDRKIETVSSDYLVKEKPYDKLDIFPTITQNVEENDQSADKRSLLESLHKETFVKSVSKQEESEKSSGQENDFQSSLPKIEVTHSLISNKNCLEGSHAQIEIDSVNTKEKIDVPCSDDLLNQMGKNKNQYLEDNDKQDTKIFDDKEQNLDIKSDLMLKPDKMKLMISEEVKISAEVAQNLLNMPEITSESIVTKEKTDANNQEEISGSITLDKNDPSSQTVCIDQRDTEKTELVNPLVNNEELIETKILQKDLEFEINVEKRSVNDSFEGNVDKADILSEKSIDNNKPIENETFLETILENSTKYLNEGPMNSTKVSSNIVVDTKETINVSDSQQESVSSTTGASFSETYSIKEQENVTKSNKDGGKPALKQGDVSVVSKDKVLKENLQRIEILQLEQPSQNTDFKIEANELQSDPENESLKDKLEDVKEKVVSELFEVQESDSKIKTSKTQSEVASKINESSEIEAFDNSSKYKIEEPDKTLDKNLKFKETLKDLTSNENSKVLSSNTCPEPSLEATCSSSSEKSSCVLTNKIPDKLETGNQLTNIKEPKQSSKPVEQLEVTETKTSDPHKEEEEERTKPSISSNRPVNEESNKANNVKITEAVTLKLTLKANKSSDKASSIDKKYEICNKASNLPLKDVTPNQKVEVNDTSKIDTSGQGSALDSVSSPDGYAKIVVNKKQSGTSSNIKALEPTASESPKSIENDKEKPLPGQGEELPSQNVSTKSVENTSKAAPKAPPKEIPAPVRVSARQKQRQAAAAAALAAKEKEKTENVKEIALKKSVQEKTAEKRGKKSASPSKEVHVKVSAEKPSDIKKQVPHVCQKSPKPLETKSQTSPKKFADSQPIQEKLEPITLKLSKEDNPVIVRSSSLSPKKVTSPNSPQTKALNYTLKIGKDSATIVPKDQSISPKTKETSAGSASPKRDLSSKVGYIIKDTGLTITPIAPTETHEQKLSKITLKLSKAGGHPEIKQEKSETWKAIQKLGEIDIVPVEEKSSNDNPPRENKRKEQLTESESPEKKVKLADDTAEPSTSSGMSKLQGLLTQAPLNVTDTSDDVQFVGFVPPTDAQRTEPGTYDIGLLKPESEPSMPKKRGRPRKITSPDEMVHSVPRSLPPGLTAKDILAASLQHQSLQHHYQQMQLPQQMQQPVHIGQPQEEDQDSSVPMFPVPLFDLSEDTYIEPHTHPTVFPDQVQPDTIMRSARGRPIGRSRRSRGTGPPRGERGGPRGRPRGSRGIKRMLEDLECLSYPDMEQPITLDNIDAEIPRIIEPPPTSQITEKTMALLRKSIECKKEILEKKARKSDGSDNENKDSDIDAKVQEMKQKIEAAYKAELKSPSKIGMEKETKKTTEKSDKRESLLKKGPPQLIPIASKADKTDPSPKESNQVKAVKRKMSELKPEPLHNEGKESLKRKLSEEKVSPVKEKERKLSEDKIVPNDKERKLSEERNHPVKEKERRHSVGKVSPNKEKERKLSVEKVSSVKEEERTLNDEKISPVEQKERKLSEEKASFSKGKEHSRRKSADEKSEINVVQKKTESCQIENTEEKTEESSQEGESSIINLAEDSQPMDIDNQSQKVEIEEKTEPEPPPKPVKPKPKSKAEIKRIKREKDRLRREAKKLAALEALKAPPPNPSEEDTRMSASDPNGDGIDDTGIKKSRMEVGDPEGKEFTVEQIAEYQWPLVGGELYMIQEQISAYLGVKSFKRKYPEIKRRPVEMEERTYLCDSGLVRESMCDLGLTAVSSSEVLDIMFQDFQDQYEELRKHMREKAARELINKQRERKKFEQSLSKSDLKEQAIQSSHSWNQALNRSRTETRRCHLDLQTWTVQYPLSRGAKMTRPTPKLGNYPVALIPGQYSDYYKRYTPQELRYWPINTVLYGPLQPNEMNSTTGGSDGSQSESEDSSSSDDSSESSSEGEGTEEEEGGRECKACGGGKRGGEGMVRCSQCGHNSSTTTVWA